MHRVAVHWVAVHWVAVHWVAVHWEDRLDLLDRDGVGRGGDVSVGGSQGSVGQGGGAGLVRPGVGGEPGGEPQVLAGAVVRVNITPPGSGAVNTLAVTLTITMPFNIYLRN